MNNCIKWHLPNNSILIVQLKTKLLRFTTTAPGATSTPSAFIKGSPNKYNLMLNMDYSSKFESFYLTFISRCSLNSKKVVKHCYRLTELKCNRYPNLHSFELSLLKKRCRSKRLLQWRVKRNSWLELEKRILLTSFTQSWSWGTSGTCHISNFEWLPRIQSSQMIAESLFKHVCSITFFSAPYKFFFYSTNIF